MILLSNSDRRFAILSFGYASQTEIYVTPNVEY